MKAFFEPDGDAMPGTKKDSFKVVPQVLQSACHVR
jgi:hypothetical protein